MQEINYAVTGMTCGGCVKRVQATLAAYAESATVTLDPPQVTLTNPKANFMALNKALQAAGNYALLPPTAETVADQVLPTDDIAKSWFATYKPLLLVFAYILLVTVTVEFSQGEFIAHRFMPHFMAGFFLVFSFFKLLDINGFATSYAMYDLLAKRVPQYGFIYPFIELGLGVWYVLGWQAYWVNWVTLIVMGFSTVGVILAVAKRQKIRCACLGTGFNLPMTTVTIIEDLTMVAMAAWMLIRI